MSSRTVLLLSPDPYLAFLLERHPQGLAITVGDRALRISSVVAARTDLVICEQDDPRLHDLQEALGGRVVVVAAPGARTTTPRVIRRPLSAEEVQRAIEPADGGGGPSLFNDPLGALARLYPWGLVLAGLVAALSLHLRPLAFPLVLPAYGLAMYGLARRRLRRRTWWFVDVAVAAAAGLAMNGVRGGFVVLSLVVAVGLGLHLGPRAVLTGSVVLGAANAIGPALSIRDGLDVPEALQTLLLFPLVAVLAAAGHERSRTSGERAQERLAVILRELRTLAGTTPQALQVSEVVRGALSSVLLASDHERGLLLLEIDGELAVAAHQGTGAEATTALLWPDWRDELRAPIVRTYASALPSALRWLDEGGGVTLMPFEDHAVIAGVILIAGSVPRRRQRAAVGAARVGAARVTNARSFARLRTDTVDEERRRLAGELHDSTAQVLAHVRLELELLARSGGGDPDELRRLARVTARAQEDLRQVINGLRASVEDEGLAGALRAYVADLRSRSGPTLHFAAHTTYSHTEETEREVFRIAQEAISNAVRHAAANTIDVLLDIDELGIDLAVDDDGHGMALEPSPSGLGLDQMRARAVRLGGYLDVTSTGVGTKVALHVDVVSDRPQRTNEGRTNHA